MNQLERRTFEELVAREGFGGGEAAAACGLISNATARKGCYALAAATEAALAGKEIYDILSDYSKVGCVASQASGVAAAVGRQLAEIRGISPTAAAVDLLEAIRDGLNDIKDSLKDCIDGEPTDKERVNVYAPLVVRFTAERTRLEAIPAPTKDIQSLKGRVFNLLDVWIQAPQNYLYVGNRYVNDLMLKQYATEFETAARNYVPPKEKYIAPDPEEEAPRSKLPLILGGVALLGFALTLD